MRRRSPLITVVEGLIAGAVGAGIQSLFFAATEKLAPAPPKAAFTPPEPQQRSETETETVARRAVELFAERGPLSPAAKRRGGQWVHFGFGAGWGALYGLACATWPRLLRPAGVGAFSLGVWAIGDNVIVPAFRLGAWPQHYPLRTHAYALAAHLVYGAGVAAALAFIDDAPSLAALALALATRRRPVRARLGRWAARVGLPALRARERVFASA